MEQTPPLTREGDHNAGRRAREVYRYFRPERLAPISENASISSSGSSHRGRVFRDDQSLQQRRDSSVSPHLSTSQSTWTTLESMPESMVLGDSSSTLNSFAQLAALRLNVDRVFIR